MKLLDNNNKRPIIGTCLCLMLEHWTAFEDMFPEFKIFFDLNGIDPKNIFDFDFTINQVNEIQNMFDEHFDEHFTVEW